MLNMWVHQHLRHPREFKTRWDTLDTTASVHMILYYTVHGVGMYYKWPHRCVDHITVHCRKGAWQCMRHAMHDMPRGMASGQVLASLAHPTIRTCPGEALAKD